MPLTEPELRLLLGTDKNGLVDPLVLAAALADAAAFPELYNLITATPDEDTEADG